MVTISDFKEILVDNWPMCLSIIPIDPKAHESMGIIATFYTGRKQLKRAELRQVGNDYALILAKYSDQELPDYWKDSVIIWQQTEPNPREIYEAGEAAAVEGDIFTTNPYPADTSRHLIWLCGWLAHQYQDGLFSVKEKTCTT